jgi:hypothetical protein
VSGSDKVAVTAQMEVAEGKVVRAPNVAVKPDTVATFGNQEPIAVDGERPVLVVETPTIGAVDQGSVRPTRGA